MTMPEAAMESLYVLGTGNAAALNCYNTCFALKDGQEYLLVDAGGGNGILRILRDMDIPITDIHHIIVTHEHTDHILGVIWMIRMIAGSMKRGQYKGNLCIYGHRQLLEKLRMICVLTLRAEDCALFDRRILFVSVSDGDTVVVNRYDTTFFDIHSLKARQFGFSLKLHNGSRLTCLGDEPYNPHSKPYAEGADWLLCEAFCLYAEWERFKPHEKKHSTVRDAALNAQQLGVKNLILWHTEDTDLPHRKQRYSQEAKEHFCGKVYVPNDREIIQLDDL